MRKLVLAVALVLAFAQVSSAALLDFEISWGGKGNQRWNTGTGWVEGALYLAGESSAEPLGRAFMIVFETAPGSGSRPNCVVDITVGDIELRVISGGSGVFDMNSMPLGWPLLMGDLQSCDLGDTATGRKPNFSFSY